MKAASAALLLQLMSQAANYSVKTAQLDGVEAVQLSDAAHKTEVTVVPSIGNIAYRMMVNGKNALWVPYESLAEMKSKAASILFSGIFQATNAPSARFVASNVCRTRRIVPARNMAAIRNITVSTSRPLRTDIS